MELVRWLIGIGGDCLSSTREKNTKNFILLIIAHEEEEI